MVSWASDISCISEPACLLVTDGVEVAVDALHLPEDRMQNCSFLLHVSEEKDCRPDLRKPIQISQVRVQVLVK